MDGKYKLIRRPNNHRIAEKRRTRKDKTPRVGEKLIKAFIVGVVPGKSQPKAR
jgi:hypothetical protein